MTASSAAVVMSSSALPPSTNPMTNAASTAAAAPSPHHSPPRKSVQLDRGNQPVQLTPTSTPKPPPRQQLLQQQQQHQQQPQTPRIESIQRPPSQRQRPTEQTSARTSSQQVPPSSTASSQPTGSHTSGSSSPASASTPSPSPPQSAVNLPHPSKPASNGRRGSDASDGGGEIIGEYVLGDTIGKGTFGKVKLGLHLITGEKVAVKILEKKRIVQIADVERVAREIKILKRNRHANVIQLFEVIDSLERIFLVMEHVDGGEMFEYIVAHHRLRESEAAPLFRQIVDGLAYLHANEVTHRDLKPENLLLQSMAYPQPGGASFVVKIVDFGLSNTHDGGRLLRTACGSPCYAAPEMIDGKLYRGPMADVWSLGVVLFAMVCGFLPFEDSNTNMLYKKILSADYKMPPFLSPAAQDLIRRIFETDPEKRLPLDLIRQHAWVTGRSASTISSAPNTPRASSVPSLTLPSSSSSSTVSVTPVDNASAASKANVDTSRVLREMVFTQLDALDVDTAEVEVALRQNAHNSFTASYYLLYNKLQRAFKGRTGAAFSSTGLSSASRSAITRGYSTRQSTDSTSWQSDGTPRASAQPSGMELGPTGAMNAVAGRSASVQTRNNAVATGEASSTSRRTSDALVVTPRRAATPQQQQPQPTLTSVQQQQQQLRNGTPPQRPGSVRGGRHIVVATGGGIVGQMQGVGPNPPPPSSSSSHPNQPTGLPFPRAPANGGGSIGSGGNGAGHAGTIASGGAIDVGASRSHVSNAMVALKPLTNAPRPELPPSLSGQRRVPDRRHTVDSGDSPPQSASASVRTPPSVVIAAVTTQAPTPASVGVTTTDASSASSGGAQSVVATANGSTIIRRRPHAPAVSSSTASTTPPSSSASHRPVPPDRTPSRPSSSSKTSSGDGASSSPMAATPSSGKEDDTRGAQRSEPARIPVPPRWPSTRGAEDKTISPS